MSCSEHTCHDQDNNETTPLVAAHSSQRPDDDGCTPMDIDATPPAH
jgi:hypothetical protein